MMNRHIELVKKWLANPKSVTQQELQANCDAAYADCLAKAAAAFYATAYASYVDADSAAEATLYATLYAALYAADYAYAGDDVNAEYWVNRYEELKEKDE
jgi:hypothetical protein